eukprot:PLAT214.4.p1 GENE.PLAT214.4~~PLAT214.4.p1  ORF type:complete len:469 (+),score=206.17 PLAT214.4:356-1762(+)
MVNGKVVFTSAFLALFLYTPLLRLTEVEKPLHWDWSAVDFSQVAFPSDFVWGTATAAYQTEGDSHNANWKVFEDNGGINKGQKCGNAVEHWKRYKEDIALMKELGVSSYRFSLAWSKIQPSQGEVDEAALQHYQDVIDAVEQAGMTAMITLHHFTAPIWFEQLGGWERAENVALFGEFTDIVFRAYGDRVHLWCTINEPLVHATLGWTLGVHAPGKKDGQLTQVVATHLMQAHTLAYRTIKALPHGAHAQVGLVKNFNQFHPATDSLGDRFLASTLHHMFNGATLNYLKNGVYDSLNPMAGSVIHRDGSVHDSNVLDFLGINYYSHSVVGFDVSKEHMGDFVHLQQEGPLTEMNYTVYAEGLYQALHAVKSLDVPIYITENGAPDSGHSVRRTWIKRYLYAIYRAMQDGIDVRGFYYWTLMDNFEWAEGWEQKFGLFAVDLKTQKRTWKSSAQPFKDMIAGKRWPQHA